MTHPGPYGDDLHEILQTYPSRSRGAISSATPIHQPISFPRKNTTGLHSGPILPSGVSHVPLLRRNKKHSTMLLLVPASQSLSPVRPQSFPTLNYLQPNSSSHMQGIILQARISYNGTTCPTNEPPSVYARTGYVS